MLQSQTNTHKEPDILVNPKSFMNLLVFWCVSLSEFLLYVEVEKRQPKHKRRLDTEQRVK
jgi:hypothetical protein